MDGGGPTIIEFLLIIDGSKGGGWATCDGAIGAAKFVKANWGFSSGIGGKGIESFGGAGIFDL